MMNEEGDNLEKLPYCECDCGERVSKSGNRFIRGHNLKINNPMKNSKIVKRNFASRKLPSEVRVCICGCEETFICKIKSKQQFINGHQNRGKFHYMKDSMEAKKNGLARKGKPHSSIQGDNNPAKKLENRIKIKENHADFSGDKNPNWNGGSSLLPYPPEFNEELKESIRERDNRKCQLCGKTKVLEGKRLDVHHIDYNKANCHPSNLIALCCGCNLKVNSNREYWQAIFEEMNCVWLST